jgi:hypothetical protein
MSVLDHCLLDAGQGSWIQMYSRLVLLRRERRLLLDTYQSVDVQTKPEPVRHLWDAADKFAEYFEQHRLYFTKDVCSNIDGLNSKLSEACSSLVFFFQEAAAIKVTNDQIGTYGRGQWIKLKVKCRKSRSCLNSAFESCFGVLQPTTTRDA